MELEINYSNAQDQLEKQELAIKEMADKIAEKDAEIV
jgi:hypothetical protein